MGLVRPRGRGSGGVCFASGARYLKVIAVGFRGGQREDRAFLSCGGGVGRGSRDGGRDGAWWSGKSLEVIDVGIAMQR